MSVGAARGVYQCYRAPLTGPESCNYHLSNCMSFLKEDKKDLIEQSLLQARSGTAIVLLLAVVLLRKCALQTALKNGLQTTGNIYSCLAHLQGLLEIEEVYSADE